LHPIATNFPAYQDHSVPDNVDYASPLGLSGEQSRCRSVDITEDLPRITVPTLVVNATEDLLVDPANSRALAAAVPGAEYVEIEAGHVLMAEQPEQWWNTIADFLDRHEF
jgi:pimeloyl-ACP methyl ester carboxylesterase